MIIPLKTHHSGKDLIFSAGYGKKQERGLENFHQQICNK